MRGGHYVDERLNEVLAVLAAVARIMVAQSEADREAVTWAADQAAAAGRDEEAARWRRVVAGGRCIHDAWAALAEASEQAGPASNL